MKKKSHDVLSKLLQKTPSSEMKKMISVYDLVPNPDNGYGIRDIEKLMAQIKVSKNVTQLEVKIMPDGKYMLISGHRRREAVIRLIKEGFTGVGPELPCLVKNYSASDGKTAAEKETLDLILSNEHRDSYTIDEKLWKLEKLRPIAKNAYEQGLKDGSISGAFRHYFAPIMGMSSSALQRLESLRNLSDTIKHEVDAGHITMTAAAELASLSVDEQDDFFNQSKLADTEITVKSVKKYKADAVQPAAECKEDELETSSCEDNTEDTPSTSNLLPEVPNEVPDYEDEMPDNEDTSSKHNLTEKDLENKGQEKLFPENDSITTVDPEPVETPVKVKTPEEIEKEIDEGYEKIELKQRIGHYVNRTQKFCAWQRETSGCEKCILWGDAECTAHEPYKWHLDKELN